MQQILDNKKEIWNVNPNGRILIDKLNRAEVRKFNDFCRVTGNTQREGFRLLLKLSDQAAGQRIALLKDFINGVN